MLRIIVKFSNWLELLQKTIISFFKVLVLSRSSKNFLSQKTNSERIVILGNGPSFKDTFDGNKTFFQNCDLICLNHFAKTNLYSDLKPEYYFVIAHDLFLDDAIDEYKNASIKLFTEIANKTTWRLKFFITYEAKTQKRWQRILSKNENIEVIFMNITPVEGFKCFRYYWYNRGKGMVRPHNVMIPSIYFSISLGVKEIILVGAEHSWLHELHVDDDNNTLFFNKHFYEPNGRSQKCNHKGTSYMKLHEVIRSFSSAFEGYHVLEEYSKAKGVQIINCSPNSFIDAFTKKKLTELK